MSKHISKIKFISMRNQHKLLNLKNLNKYTHHHFRRFKSEQSSKTTWNSVIGLEVHAQISSYSKLFSGASTDFASPVNTNVSLFDAAIPGTLPVLNKKCVEAGVMTALALSCKVNAISMFDRKHYFYADLPAGYQITQQRAPLANDGVLNFQVYTPGVHKEPYKKSSRLKQLQLEQDSGKSLHDEEMSRSLVDLNRAGVALMELVFEPDLSDGEEAAALVKELAMILQRLETCSCKMEEGALRVDANVSINRPGEPLGVRSEVKNIGSIRGVAAAVKYEIERQISTLENGLPIINETRAWDAQKKVTIPMRDKEVVQDYRFMPEPNLPPLHLNLGLDIYHSDRFVNVQHLQSKMPELPEETRQSLINDHHLSAEHAIIIVNDDVLLKCFIKMSAKAGRDKKLIANILINELLTLVNKNKLDMKNLNVSAEKLGGIIDLLQSKDINLVIARKVLHEIIVIQNHKNPKTIVVENNWSLIRNREDLIKLCERVMLENPQLVTQFVLGKTKVFNALLGKIAQISEQRANMAEVTKILKELLPKK